MENYERLSADDLKAHLERLDAEKTALSRALESRREQDKRRLATEIKVLIKERGHDVGEIAELVLGRRRRAGAQPDPNAGYTRYADPDNPNNTYVRGRLPNWLIEKMSANGYDPHSPEQRAQFKEQHLVRVAA
jgi:DNA-binding protein H-NS